MIHQEWETYLVGRSRPGRSRAVGLVDIGLAVVALSMLLTDQTVLLFHLIFALLAVGAFFWPFRSFVTRSIIWVSVATAEVISAVYVGTTQIDELIEIPLLTIILLTVYAIAQHRAKSQQQSDMLNQELTRRLAELDIANKALRCEEDARARLQEEVLRSHEQYVQMVIHDLKNPLTAIRGYLDMLRPDKLASDQRLVVENARLSCRRMLDLVSDTLDIARFEEGHLELRREPTNIGALLQDCVAELQPLLELGEARTQLSMPADSLVRMVDAGLLRRVVSNLLSNAVKHNVPGTTIRLGAEHAGIAGARLWVADNGAGIPIDQQPALFKRFGTLAPSRAKQGSTGLGLAFCKLAVEAHGGAITIDSAPGAGTTFVITLPAEHS